MQQKINAIFTKRVLELNGSLGFNDSLSSRNRSQVSLAVKLWRIIKLFLHPAVPSVFSLVLPASVHVVTSNCPTLFALAAASQMCASALIYAYSLCWSVSEMACTVLRYSKVIKLFVFHTAGFCYP